MMSEKDEKMSRWTSDDVVQKQQYLTKAGRERDMLSKENMELRERVQLMDEHYTRLTNLAMDLHTWGDPVHCRRLINRAKRLLSDMGQI